MDRTLSGVPRGLARPAYVSREKALEVLGVKPQTLYSYVSRGLVRRYVEHGGRPSYYNLQDVQRLRARSLARSGHGPAAANALHWGEPVLSTGITEITVHGPVYREHLAIELARRKQRFEAVAEYLWTGAGPADDVIWCEPEHELLTRQLNEIIRSYPKVRIRQLFTEIALLLGVDQVEHEGQPAAGVQQARGLMHAMIGAFGLLGPVRRYIVPRKGDTVACALARAVGIRPSPAVMEALNQVLVIVADHEFTSATFAARIAAAAGNNLYSCVSAALQVHYGAARCDQVEQWLRTADSVDGRRGPPDLISHDFDHPLYHEGDPRVAAIMEIVEGVGSSRRVRGPARQSSPAALPGTVNLDYALVASCRALGAVPQAAGGLLAFGRMAGWIAHALEQQKEDFLIRPRAKFVPHRTTTAASTIAAGENPGFGPSSVSRALRENNTLRSR